MLADLTLLATGLATLENHLSELSNQMKQPSTPAQFSQRQIWSKALECAIGHINQYKEKSNGPQFNQSEHRHGGGIKVVGDGPFFPNDGSEQRTGSGEIPAADGRVVCNDLPAEYNDQDRSRRAAGHCSENVARCLANAALYLVEQGNTESVSTLLAPFLCSYDTCESARQRKQSARIILAINHCRNGQFSLARACMEDNSSEIGDFFRSFISVLETSENRRGAGEGFGLQAKEAERALQSLATRMNGALRNRHNP